MRRFWIFLLAIIVIVPSIGQSAPRSPFADPAIPPEVREELEPLFENFLIEYGQASGAERKELVQIFFKQVDLFALQLLQANRRKTPAVAEKSEREFG